MLEQLPERLSNYRTVPGHGPDISRKTDYVKLMESMFDTAFNEDAYKDNDDI
ncbi:hypothetical protein [Paenibacillus solani]|uniref:hypothetical protein n=1 Tax=Paenibacillus solani TaxID=1705565 RepID=UPI003D2B2D34